MRPAIKRILFCCVPLFCASTVTLAVPIEPISGGPGSVRWIKGSTIDVYIPPDPDGKGREGLIKEGVERWIKPLADKGVTIKVTIGSVPADAKKDYVLVKWADAGSVKDNANPDDEGSGTPIDDGKGHIVASRIDIDRGVTGDTYIKNLGSHEFGHASGLADDTSSGTDKDGKPAKNVMNPKIPTDKDTGFTDKDNKELDTIYADAGGNFPQGAIAATATALGGGVYHYAYDVTWTGGPEIPVVQFGTNGSPVFNVSENGFQLLGTNAYAPTPDGWFWFDRRSDFTALGYMEDTAFVRLPADSNPPFLTFVNQMNPLSAENTFYTFAFDSIAGPGTIQAYISEGENIREVAGPGPIPEPSALTLFLVGLASLASMKTSRRKIAPAGLQARSP
jgi:hypothetical protein